MKNMRVTSWAGYCHAIGKGGTLLASYARLCERLGCEDSTKSRQKAGVMLARGEIDGETYATYILAIDATQEAKSKGVQTHVVSTPDSDWLPCHGGNMRRIHRNSDS